MWGYLGQGVLLGVSAGIAPGPLFALVIAETLRHGVRSGLRVALAPLLTDLPIVIVTVFVLSRLSNFDGVLGAISLVGGLVVLWMAYESLVTKPIDPDAPPQEPKSLRKGIIVNALSPHPYLFWFTVGAPTTLKAAEQSTLSPWAFIGGFYVCLIGAKVGLAVITARSKSFLNGAPYLCAMRFLGLLLALFALVLFRDGLQFFGIL